MKEFFKAIDAKDLKTAIAIAIAEEEKISEVDLVNYFWMNGAWEEIERLENELDS